MEPNSIPADDHGPDAEPPSVALIVPVYGDARYLNELLEALDATMDVPHELVLVDNGTGHPIEERPERIIIRNPVNEGFAKASNAGARAATAPIVIMLNVDTVPQSGWIRPLLAAFDDPSVAMAGPKLTYPDGRIQCAGIRTWHGNGSAGGENRHDEHPSNSDEDGVTGACMAIRRSAFEAAGGFDEVFWNGYEDVDLCLAIRAARHRVAYVAESTVRHHESVSGPERWRAAPQNVAYMNGKWGSR